MTTMNANIVTYMLCIYKFFCLAKKTFSVTIVLLLSSLFSFWLFCTLQFIFVHTHTHAHTQSNASDFATTKKYMFQRSTFNIYIII